MSEKRTALVAGATGLVGGHVVSRLLTDPTYASVTALVRRPGSLQAPHPKLREAVVDFDRLDAAADQLAARDVFCGLGTTLRKAGSRPAFRKVDHDYVVELASRALAAGAENFLLVSSVGAEAGSGHFYLRVKAEAEDAVAGLGYRAVHVFRPSFLIGERDETRLGEKLGGAVARLADPLLAVLPPLRRYRAIAADTVAAAMIAAARSESTGLNIHHYDEMRQLSSGPARNP